VENALSAAMTGFDFGDRLAFNGEDHVAPGMK
jgi:hypothetical protein